MDLLLIEFHKAGIILPSEKLDEETRLAWIKKRRELEAKGMYCSSFTYRNDIPYFCQLSRNHEGRCFCGPRDLSILEVGD